MGSIPLPGAKKSHGRDFCKNGNQGKKEELKGKKPVLDALKRALRFCVAVEIFTLKIPQFQCNLHSKRFSSSKTDQPSFVLI